jgi:hypothetical protein
VPKGTQSRGHMKELQTTCWNRLDNSTCRTQTFDWTHEPRKLSISFLTSRTASENSIMLRRREEQTFLSLTFLSHAQQRTYWNVLYLVGCQANLRTTGSASSTTSIQILLSINPRIVWAVCLHEDHSPIWALGAWLLQTFVPGP